MFDARTTEVLEATIARHPYPLLFVTVSGAHLYGFASPDSDVDLRGVHCLPLTEVLGLEKGEETITEMERGEVETDLVTHDAAKFFTLMLRRNGYVLEQLLSPLVLRTSPEHAELVELAGGCITRHHAHHYLGFADTQWRLFEKERPRRIKPLLYVLRVLLTGIHLMRTGRVEANLRVLNEDARLTYVDELIARKAGAEKGTLDGGGVVFYRAEYERLVGELERARDASSLPERSTVKREMHELLIRVRMKWGGKA